MRKLFLWLPTAIIFCAASLFLASCSDEGDDGKPYSLKVNPPTYTFTHSSGTQVFSVETDAPTWTATPSAEWLSVAPDYAANTFSVTVTSWDGDDDRTASVVVKAGSTEVPVAITQQQFKITFQVTPSSYAFPAYDFTSHAASFTQEFKVETEAKDWKVELNDNSWFSVEKKSDELFTITAPANTVPNNAPSAIATLSATGAEEGTVRVSQPEADPMVPVMTKTYNVTGTPSFNGIFDDSTPGPATFSTFFKWGLALEGESVPSIWTPENWGSGNPAYMLFIWGEGTPSIITMTHEVGLVTPTDKQPFDYYYTGGFIVLPYSVLGIEYDPTTVTSPIDTIALSPMSDYALGTVYDSSTGVMEFFDLIEKFELSDESGAVIGSAENVSVLYGNLAFNAVENATEGEIEWVFGTIGDLYSGVTMTPRSSSSLNAVQPYVNISDYSLPRRELRTLPGTVRTTTDQIIRLRK